MENEDNILKDNQYLTKTIVNDVNDFNDISSREGVNKTIVTINRGVEGDAPKDGKIHSFKTLEELKAEKKEYSETEKSFTSRLSFRDMFEDKKQILQIPSISEKPLIPSSLDVKSNEDVKSTIPEPRYMIVGEPAFDGNCELCGGIGVDAAFKFEGSSTQYYAHKSCLQNIDAVNRFYRLIMKKDKTAIKALDVKQTALEERVKAAREIYSSLLEPSIGMVEEDLFLKALSSIDSKPEGLLDHLKKCGRIFNPRDRWVRWIK